ncbi:MAG TPA: hypothetical protein GX401_02380 [Clostridiales bacterium]|nr:hypothetical protein [Clostridiales bacterium]
MDKMTPTDWVALLSVFGMVLSIVVSIVTISSRGRNKAADDAELKNDVKHIKLQVDDTASEIKALNSKVGNIENRVTAVEQSCKSAHHRIDRIEKIESEE